MAIPREITGSIGGRIRVIFGDNGNEWLLLQNHDNGDTKWQIKDWKGIPANLAKQINNCTAKGRDIKNVDFGPDMAWFVNGEKSDGSGSHSWWGGTSADIKAGHKVSFGTDIYGNETHVLIDGRNGYMTSGNLHDDVIKRLKRINSRKKEIQFVRLFGNGRYFISDDEGTEWRLNNEHLTTELKKPGAVEDVALAVDGSWLIIRENKFVASTGVDKDLDRKLAKFYADQRRWQNQRRQEIREARVREQEDEERAAAAIVLERERVEREAREAAEREREERERAQLRARETDRAAAAQERVERDAATRISSLEAKLEKRFLDEAREIKEMEENLQRRKLALLDEMPDGLHSRSGLSNTTAAAASTCVVCRDETAVVAVVPCGHLCLCTDCSVTCISDNQPCPLCRGEFERSLRIYSGDS